jgi:hypothetical protein
MKIASAIVGGGLALALAAGSAHAAQFAVNGDFTQLSKGPGQFDTNTTVTGWSGNGGYNFVFNVAASRSRESLAASPCGMRPMAAPAAGTA